MLVVAAGERNAFPEDVEAVGSHLTPLDHRNLCQAIQVRAKLAFRSPPTRDAVGAIARLSVSRVTGCPLPPWPARSTNPFEGAVVGESMRIPCWK